MKFLERFRWYIIAVVTVLAWLASGRNKIGGTDYTDTLTNVLGKARNAEKARRRAKSDEELKDKRSSPMSSRLRGALDRARRRRTDRRD